jgi:hypothetical protein
MVMPAGRYFSDYSSEESSELPGDGLGAPVKTVEQFIDASNQYSA